MATKEQLRNYLIERLREEAASSGYKTDLIPAPQEGEEMGRDAAIDESVKRTLDAIATNTHLLYGCTTVEGIAEPAIDEVVEYLDKTVDFIKQNNPFAAERDLWQRCSEFDDGTFEAHWEQLHPYLERRYTRQELDVKFYIDEFYAVLGPEYPLLRQGFLEDWDRSLWLKEVAYELEILNRVRRQLERDLTSRITSFYSASGMSPLVISLLWGNNFGQWKRSTVTLLRNVDALCRNNPTIRTLLDALGRKGDSRSATEIGYQERERHTRIHYPTATRSDIDGVGESNRLDALLPTEVALLGERRLEETFYKKYVERRLQTFDFRSHIRIRERTERPTLQADRKGPYIVCIDTSGSMAGKPEEVAKAICYGLIDRSSAEGRHCYGISFSTRIEVLDLSDLQNNRQKIQEFLIHSFSGGTDLKPAIKQALKMLKREEFQLADVLFISDFLADDFDPITLTCIVQEQARNVKFHALTIGSMGCRSLLGIFDELWSYRHRTNRIEKTSMEELKSFQDW